jgi:hypothetical protein
MKYNGENLYLKFFFMKDFSLLLQIRMLARVFLFGLFNLQHTAVFVGRDV